MQTIGLNEIRSEGMKALTERLGYSGALRFIGQFESGYGDYTKDREKLQEGLTVDDVAAEIYRRREKKI